MIKRKPREYASAEEYLIPFPKRYRRVFWFDAILSFLHLPLLVYLLIQQPFDGITIKSWSTSFTHISIAGLGIIANSLLLRDASFSTVIAYFKILYSFATRIVLLLIASRNISISLLGETVHVHVDALTLLESALPIFIVLLLYQGFYGGCVYLYSKWKKQLKETFRQPVVGVNANNAG